MSFFSRVFSFGRSLVASVVAVQAVDGGAKPAQVVKSPAMGKTVAAVPALPHADALMAQAAPVLMPEAQAFADGIALALRSAKPRPFAAFRGDVRRQPRRRAAPGKATMRRVVAMSATMMPDRASNVRKLQRGLRIIKRSQVTA